MSTAPRIILKLDDLRGGKPARPSKDWPEHVSNEWRWLGDFFTARKIRASIGVICNTLEADDAEYFRWIRELHTSGLVEFWFHAYDHVTWTAPDGVERNEFDRPYAEQRWRFARGQQLAREKLGITFHVFGAPGSGAPGPTTNADTFAVMVNEPDMRAWFYGRLDEPGRQLAAGGEVVLLERVPEVNIEYPVFVPDAEKFRAGFAGFAPGRDYFHIQGHPQKWYARGFAEFEKIVDFAVAQGCEFVTPSEYAAAVASLVNSDAPPSPTPPRVG